LSDTPTYNLQDPDFQKWWYGLQPAHPDYMKEAFAIGWFAGRDREKAAMGERVAFLRDGLTDTRDQLVRDLSAAKDQLITSLSDMSKELADKLDDSARAGLQGLVEPPVREAATS